MKRKLFEKTRQYRGQDVRIRPVRRIIRILVAVPAVLVLCGLKCILDLWDLYGSPSAEITDVTEGRAL